MKRIQAHAKINLYLHITGRRADSYHTLDSLAIFASSHDLVSIQFDTQGEGAAGQVNLDIDGPFASDLATCENNLISRAATLLRPLASAGHRPDLNVTLTKNLPVASGIGGGSADAAAALRGIGEAWGVDEKLLPEIALQLGADVPVCLSQRAMRMRGIGENLTSAPVMPPFHLLIVNPGVAVSTPAVFSAWKSRNPAFRPEAVLPVKWETLETMVATLRTTVNDLEVAARQMCPPIDKVLDTLDKHPGCLFSRMSGSGATCFGLFSDARLAYNASESCRQNGWWADAGPALI